MKGPYILALTLTNIDNELHCYSNEFPNHLFYINYDETNHKTLSFQVDIYPIEIRSLPLLFSKYIQSRS